MYYMHIPVVEIHLQIRPSKRIAKLIASLHIMGSDPLAISIKKGEKFLREAALEGEYYFEGE